MVIDKYNEIFSNCQTTYRPSMRAPEMQGQCTPVIKAEMGAREAKLQVHIDIYLLNKYIAILMALVKTAATIFWFEEKGIYPR